MNRIKPVALLGGLALCLVLAGNSFASSSALHPVIPGGIPSNNAGKAAKIVLQRASYDPNLAMHIAQETGASTFNAGDYVAAGYQHGAPGTVNAGESNTGVIVATADTAECNVHSKMLRIKNTATGEVVLFCVGCGNIRLHVSHPVRPHPFTWGTTLRFKWVVNKQFVKTCPDSTQQVTVYVNVTVKGFIRVRTWGRAVRIVKHRISVKVHHSINIKIKISCSSTPTSMSAVMNSIQEVYNDGELYPNLSGMLNSPVGDTISCALSVVNETKDGPGAGSIQDPTSYTFTSTGNNQVVGTWVYVAPNDNGGDASVGLNNYLKLVCTDLSNTKVTPATAYSLEFPVMATPPRP